MDEVIEKKSVKIQKDLSNIESMMPKMDEEAANKLQVLEYSELKYMEDHEEYLNDFGLSSPQFIQLDKINEEAQNLASKLATANVEKQNQIHSLVEANADMQTEFENKQAELKVLLEAYQKKKQDANVEISNLVKVMSQKTTELSKEAKQI